MALTQAESYADLWTQHRDYAGPVKCDDVFALREDREYTPPSKAHLKRLTKSRPEVSPATVSPKPDHSRRREINQAAAHGARIAALLGYVKPTIR